MEWMESRSANWSKPAGSFSGPSLTGLNNLSAAALRSILDTAAAFRASGLTGHERLLSGRQVALLFHERSTRTRMSFESAVVRLGAYPLVLASDASSAGKGESLLDTARNLEAMGLDLLVVRHPDPDASNFLAARIGIQVVNA